MYDLKPALIIGDYFIVTVDTPPNFNHSCVYVFVKELRGYRAVTISSNQMIGVHGGCIFRAIPMIFLTPATFLVSQLMVYTTKTKTNSVVTPYPPKSERLKKDDRSPVRICIKKLQHGSQYWNKVVWYGDKDQENRFKSGRAKNIGKTRLSHYYIQQIFLKWVYFNHTKI